MFNEEFSHSFPEHDLRMREQKEIFDKLYVMVRSQKNKPVSRRDIMQTIHNEIDSNAIPQKPVLIKTEIEVEPELKKEIQFLWNRFFGGTERVFPTSSEWNSGMYQELLDTKKWIENNRTTKRIHLSGTRRISGAIAIGAVFSAVSGFVIEAEQRGGEFWATDCHANQDTLDYEFLADTEEGNGADLIVSISITRNSIASEVIPYLKNQELSHASKLHLYAAQPIVSADQANLAAHKLKEKIKLSLLKTNAKQVHLFYAGPSHLALFFGHRWNALATLHCYEWVNTRHYVPTCVV